MSRVSSEWGGVRHEAQRGIEETKKAKDGREGVTEGSSKREKLFTAEYSREKTRPVVLKQVFLRERTYGLFCAKERP